MGNDRKAEMGKEGSLIGFFGPPGSGKGVGVVRYLMGLVAAGKVHRIITNMPLVAKKWSVPVVALDNGAIAHLNSSKLMPGDAVVVDEASFVWEATEWAKVKDETDVKDWVSQARHIGIHFVVSSQAFEEFVFFVRRKLTSAWLCWRLGPLCGSRRFIVEGGKLQQPIGMPYAFCTWFPPRRYVTAYDSMGRAGDGLVDDVKYHGSHVLRWVVLGAVGVSVGLAGFSVYRRWRGDEKKIFSPVVAGSVPAASRRVVLFPEGPKYERYDRFKMAFVDSVTGRVVDARMGLSGTRPADWGFQWDVVRAQIESSGRGVGGGVGRVAP